ncbi:hypothetical protein DPEC_G00300840 [Dallia pectoralis]|uniref:Uncharacterized protein n=1 Tax=Dallia pectoralis TaxID=75939 RepID=A0ACC2FGB9_DALPE|nr:hypothetical protein DPEC_G00300840 [Dallia pectoralis]
MEVTTTPTNVPTYLVSSIFTTLFLFWPIGIAALVFSYKVHEANKVGALEKASEASRTAKILNIVGLVIGIVFSIIAFVLKLTLG